MPDRDHWEAVYGTKGHEDLSWFRPRLDRSLAFIDACGVAVDASVVDIGGGASTLVDDLLARGMTQLSVVDLSASALAASNARLGDSAASVQWIVGDATTKLFPPGSVDVWHDRAVFHFLTDADARAAYVAELHRAVKPGGHVIVATFALDGPERCSGLPVQRYGAEELVAELGLELVEHAHEVHVTPSGKAQAFTWVRCRRVA